jgi:hypothetical protein
VGKGELNMIPSSFYVYNENINVESKIAHGRWVGKEVHTIHHLWAVMRSDSYRFISRQPRVKFQGT